MSATITPTQTPEVQAVVTQMLAIRKLRGARNRKLAEVALYEQVGQVLYRKAELAMTLPGWFKQQVLSDDAAIARQEAIVGIKASPEPVDYWRIDPMYDGEPIEGEEVEDICEELVI